MKAELSQAGNTTACQRESELEAAIEALGRLPEVFHETDPAQQREFCQAWFKRLVVPSEKIDGRWRIVDGGFAEVNAGTVSNLSCSS